jgi:hypothetical protein
MVGDIPWRIDHGSEKFRLISLDDRYVSFGDITPQLNARYPDRFEDRFVD